MKTLDEVIKALEYCNQDSPVDCMKCAYEGIDCQISVMLADALYYLKEYRDYRTLKEGIEKQKEKLLNPPLTWDKLQLMDGMPVWIEVDRSWNSKFWTLLETANDRINVYQRGQEFAENLWKRDMGKTWNAYKKERNEDIE